jgi:hypothetical protein
MGISFENVNVTIMGVKLRWKIKTNNLDEKKFKNNKL